MTYFTKLSCGRIPGLYLLMVWVIIYNWHNKSDGGRQIYITSQTEAVRLIMPRLMQNFFLRL